MHSPTCWCYSILEKDGGKNNLKRHLKGESTLAFTLQSNFPIHFVDKSEFIWPAVAFARLGILEVLCLNCVYWGSSGGRPKNKNELFARLALEFTAAFRTKIHSIPIRSAVSGPALSLPGTPSCAFCIILFVLHEQLENMWAFRRVPSFRPWRTMKCLIHEFQHSAITAGTVL